MLKKSCSIQLLAFFMIMSCHINEARATVKSYKKNISDVTFTLDKGLMKIIICRDDIIEVKYTMFKAFSTKPSLVVNNTWAQHPLFTVTDSKGDIIITTKKLNIKINKATNAITYAALNGKVITAEDKENKTMTAATIAGINTYNVSTQFISPANEALYGLGYDGRHSCPAVDQRIWFAMG